MKKMIFGAFLIYLLVAVPLNALGLNNNYFPAERPPVSIQEIRQDDNNFLDWEYFKWESKPDSKGMRHPLNIIRADSGLTRLTSQSHMLLYGEPFEYDKATNNYRFLGMSYECEVLPNPSFRNDAEPEGSLETRNWIKEPWNNKPLQDWLAKKNPKQDFNPSDWDYPSLIDAGETPYKFLPNIQKGLETFHGDELDYKNTPDWHRIVHVIQPPTYYGWGMGRMWHKKADGSIWYRSVPLAPDNVFKPWLPNLYIKDFDPGTPTETDEAGNTVYTAHPGQSYTAKVTFGIKSKNTEVDISKLPVFITGLNKTKTTSYTADLKYASGNGTITNRSLWPYVPKGRTSQAVFFKAQDSEVSATFRWTAMNDTESLQAAINYPPAFHLYYEGDTGTEYLDNVDIKSIQLKPLPDLYIKTITPGTDVTEAGVAYHGKVTYGYYKTIKDPVKARLGLTHNGYPVPGVNNLEVTFNPGETKEFNFIYHGQSTGIDSTLEAKIWPMEPTTQDINWNNNKQVITVRSKVTDIAVQSIQQSSPVEKDSNQYASATFKNLGTQAETFTARYYVGGNVVKTESITIPKGGIANKYFNWKAPAILGPVELKVIADPENKINDIRRSNNICSRTVQVKGVTPLPLYCSPTNSKTEASWEERYWLIVGYGIDENGKEYPVWEERTVTYNETLSAQVMINTKQGIPTDPNNPKPNDRESRGSWAIIPYANKEGLDPNKVTRAGYGFEVQVDTTYWTDYETKVPKGYEGTASPKGEILRGPLKVAAEFWDTNDKSAGIVELVPTVGSAGDKSITWKLPEKQHRFSDGTTVWERKHYTALNIPDGIYAVTIHMSGVGKNGLKICREEHVTIYGNMYDDIYTRPGQ